MERKNESLYKLFMAHVQDGGHDAASLNLLQNKKSYDLESWREALDNYSSAIKIV